MIFKKGTAFIHDRYSLQLTTKKKKKKRGRLSSREGVENKRDKLHLEQSNTARPYYIHRETERDTHTRGAFINYLKEARRWVTLSPRKP